MGIGERPGEPRRARRSATSGRRHRGGRRPEAGSARDACSSRIARRASSAAGAPARTWRVRLAGDRWLARASSAPRRSDGDPAMRSISSGAKTTIRRRPSSPDARRPTPSTRIRFRPPGPPVRTRATSIATGRSAATAGRPLGSGPASGSPGSGPASCPDSSRGSARPPRTRPSTRARSAPADELPSTVVGGSAVRQDDRLKARLAGRVQSPDEVGAGTRSSPPAPRPRGRIDGGRSTAVAGPGRP
jgi:hypothetical protein